MAVRYPLPLLLAGMLLVAGCGGADKTSSPTPTPSASSGDAPVHVHGLGINPGDGSLFIATHTGVFRAASGETQAKRVGTSEQDTMGFTVVGANHFLGSGHPAPGENRPPLLGLIESRDGGMTWRSLSLLGQADFHILRFARKTVYGFDVSHGTLMVREGDRWSYRKPPEPLIDLAPDPANARHLVASGQQGMYVSADQGRHWRTLGRQVGLLVWPRKDRLYLIDGSGTASVSQDGGSSWRRLGQIGGQPSAFSAGRKGELYAALADATVKESRDGGASWTVRAVP